MFKNFPFAQVLHVKFWKENKKIIKETWNRIKINIWHWSCHKYVESYFFNYVMRRFQGLLIQWLNFGIRNLLYSFFLTYTALASSLHLTYTALVALVVMRCLLMRTKATYLSTSKVDGLFFSRNSSQPCFDPNCLCLNKVADAFLQQ